MIKTAKKAAPESGAQKNPTLSEYRKIRNTAMKEIIDILSDPVFNRNPQKIIDLRTYRNLYLAASENITRKLKEKAKTRTELADMLEKKFDIDTELMLMVLKEDYDSRIDLINTEGIYSSEELKSEYIKLVEMNFIIEQLGGSDQEGGE